MSNIEDYQRAKTLGNEQFANKNYATAAEYYTLAIKLNSKLPVGYLNRAQCYIYLRRFLEAKRDCDIAIKLDGSLEKAYHRRATALMALHRYNEAKIDLDHLCDGFGRPRGEGLMLEVEKILSNDDRITINPVEKTRKLQSPLPMRDAELNNKYTGTIKYHK